MSAGENPIRILTVDDHPLFRNGIAALLASRKPLQGRLLARQVLQVFFVFVADILQKLSVREKY
jgi:hypothetical protein